MPLIRLNTGGWKFGTHGKVYYGTGARNKARKQGAAIALSKSRRKK